LRIAPAPAVLAATLLAAAVALPACSGGGGGGEDVAQAPPAAPAGAPQAPSDDPNAAAGTPLFTGGANQMEVTLYFVRADGEALAPEKRSIFRTATVNDRARQALQALLEGSEAGLQPSVPAGTTLREMYLSDDGTAYVDLSPEFVSGLSEGSSDGVEAVYSIVNTLVVNFPEIQKVKILVGGDEVDDLGGHIDLSHPILPEMGLVSTKPSGRPAKGEPAPPAGSAPETPVAPKRPAADPNKPPEPLPSSPFR